MTVMAAGQQRKIQRTVHLVAGVLLLGYVYVPAPGGLQVLVRFFVFPLLAATGVAMWQAPRIRRLRKSVASRRRNRSQRNRAPAGQQPQQHQSHAASRR
jgi:hypothetical protein